MRVVCAAFTVVGSTSAFCPLAYPSTTGKTCVVDVLRAASLSTQRVVTRPRQLAKRSVISLGLFGFGSGGKNRGSAPDASKARKTLENNAVFKSRTEQYARGGITAIDLVRSFELDVASKIPGCDLEDVVAAALELVTDKRKRNLLTKASGGRAIGPGGSSYAGSSRGGADVTVAGRQGQYVMSQGGQRISSKKSIIFNGVEAGKEGTPLKFKVTTRSNVALALAEVSNIELVRTKNGAGASSRRLVGYLEYIENYNKRGDSVMIMRAESMDLRKMAEISGGSLSQGKVRKYASEMANTIRCIHKSGLVWTDLKLDNMVVCRSGEVKAIDLESAVPVRSAPKTFSPEATPPDFIFASRSGYAGVTVDRSFDIWSLGMAILHLYRGKGYFEGSSDPQIIAKLGQPGFTVNLSEVCDGRTRGLLEGLLDLDPKKRLRYFDSPISRLALL